LVAVGIWNAEKYSLVPSFGRRSAAALIEASTDTGSIWSCESVTRFTWQNLRRAPVKDALNVTSNRGPLGTYHRASSQRASRIRTVTLDLDCLD